MNFMKLCIGILLVFPTIVFSGQQNSNFLVTFTVLPSCHIKTENINSNDIQIVSKCTHEDFYITAQSSDNNSYKESALVQNKLIINKKIIDNEIHTTISNITSKGTLLTVNF